MKLKTKHKITFEQADALIEKYYDGFTTVGEEKLLQDFLTQAGLPAKYKPEQAIFGYFETKKQKPAFNIRPYIRWAGAAAILVLAIGIQTFNWKNIDSYAYIDGVKTTNKNEIQTQALASLSNVSADNNEVEQSLENLNDNEVMQQLDVFSELNK
ncbi:MAG TPA: hypothetical protein VK152_06320 [Paludibacter sp.]|nr:hypothetical protein [Paludibacter sp.]